MEKQLSRRKLLAVLGAAGTVAAAAGGVLKGGEAYGQGTVGQSV